MKRVVLIASLVLAVAVKASATHHNPVSILSTNSSLVYLKFHKSMLGGIIEIRDEKDSVVMTEVISSKKMIIDFYYKNAGKYHIKIHKGDVVQSFSYLIQTPEPEQLPKELENNFLVVR
jgi:hypothetical protein